MEKNEDFQTTGPFALRGGPGSSVTTLVAEVAEVRRSIEALRGGMTPPAEPLDQPFARLAVMRDRLRDHGQKHHVPQPVVERLLVLAAALREAHQRAIHSQESAAGYGHTTSAAHYSDKREQLRTAAQDLAAAAQVLLP
jgi:hypothetical protein